MGRELKRKQARKQNVKVTKKQEELDYDIKKGTFIKLVLSILLILVVLYYSIAIFITKEIRISWINDNATETSSDEEINKILAKNTFNQKEETYYVYFYNFTGEDQNIANAIGLADAPVYHVDTNSALNKNYVTVESSNRNATTLAELKVKEPTFIKISSDKIIAYYEGPNEILDFLTK